LFVNNCPYNESIHTHTHHTCSSVFAYSSSLVYRAENTTRDVLSLVRLICLTLSYYQTTYAVNTHAHIHCKSFVSHSAYSVYVAHAKPSALCIFCIKFVTEIIILKMATTVTKLFSNTTTTPTQNESFFELTPQDDSIDPQKLVPYIFVPIYITLFIIGFSGNLWVISVMANIYKLFLNKTSVNRHAIFIYILSLSIVDLGVMLCLPFVVTDMILDHWMFGSVICKLYYTFESINKVRLFIYYLLFIFQVLSTFLLTAVSVDR
jgi:hypothetical protein